MTARSIFDRLDNSPAPSPASWPARRPPSVKMARARVLRHLDLTMDEALAIAEATWRSNMTRRDADAAQFGEPRDSHEFFHGRAATAKEREAKS